MANDAESRDLHTADVAELTQLKHRWSIALDDALLSGTPADAERAAAFWTADAHLDMGPFGIFEGRESVARFLTEAAQMFAWTRHHLSTGAFEVDGDDATGRWYLELYGVAAGQERIDVSLGTHRDRYARIDGAWRLEEQITVVTPLRQE